MTAVEEVETPGEAIHPAVGAAFAAFDKHEIAWVLLPGRGDLAPPSGDVEVLVDAGACRLDAVLLTAGFARIAARGHGSHRFYFAYDADEDDWIKLDVVSDVAFGREQQFETALAPALLARRRRVGEVAVPDAHDAFWHLLLHHLLSHGQVPERCREELRALAEDAAEGGPMRDLVRQIHPRVARWLRAAVAHGDWDAVARMGRALCRAWYLRDGRTLAARSASRRLERHLPPHADGMTVAVLGPDGAGKTTLARALVASTPAPARYVYLGVWKDSRFTKRMRVVFGARLAVRLATLIAKAVFIGGHRRMGRLVLLDRYTVDVDLPSAALDLRGRISAKLVRRTNAPPDLIILLDAPVELMFERKGEYGVAELQRRRDAYRAMARRFPQMVIVDAEMPADEVRREATRLVWDAWLRARRALAPGG